MNVDAIIITDLFKGNQLEEMRHWLDNETPYWEDDTWERASSGVMKKRCPELNMYHIATLDRAREIFEIHNLLPTFSSLNCSLVFLLVKFLVLLTTFLRLTEPLPPI